MKALVGAWEPRPHQLLAELRALRTRASELERELARMRAENAALRASLDVPDVDALDVDALEIVTAEPVLSQH